ncbi:MAG: hypothetical protein ACK4N5_15685, partial [Myxococcales bacterium]
ARAQTGASGSPAPTAAEAAEPTQFQIFSSLQPHAKNGEWAEYARLADGKPDFSATFRILIAEAEDPAEPPGVGLWLDKTGQSAVRLRTIPSGATEMYLKIGASIFSIEDTESEKRGPMCIGGACGDTGEEKLKDSDVKVVSLKTLAGTYKCKYTKKKTPDGDFELWSNEQIPAMAVVRMRGPKGTGMELVASGTQGKSSFPKKFKAAPLPIQKLGGVAHLLPMASRDLDAALAGRPVKKEPEPPTSCEPGTAGCALPTYKPPTGKK